MEYFEDVEVGTEQTLGTVAVTADEIVAFAEQFDPQPMHTDPDAAKRSPYGGLIASGWHTAALCMRVLVEEYLSETATQGARGVDELRWHRPVRPGDELTVAVEALDREAETDDRGLVRARVSAENQDGAKAFSMVGLVLFARRD